MGQNSGERCSTAPRTPCRDQSHPGGTKVLWLSSAPETLTDKTNDAKTLMPPARFAARRK